MFERLVNMEPKEAELWLGRSREWSFDSSAEIDWIWVAEQLGREAHASVDSSAESLRLGSLAVTVYEAVRRRGALQMSQRDRVVDEAVIPCLVLRASLIREFGPDFEESILSPDEVLSEVERMLPSEHPQDFFEAMGLHFGQSLKTELIHLPAAQLLKLRRFKEVLNILEVLPSDLVSDRQLLCAWLALREQLP